MHRFATVLFVAVVGLGCIAAEPDAAHIDALVQQLSAPEFDAREDAMAQLRKMGESIWPQLEKHLTSDDKERAMRIAKLRWEFGIVNPEQADRIKELRSELESSDFTTRWKGFCGFMELGPAGVRLARAHFSSKGAQPALQVQLHSTSITVGDTLAGNAILSNAGSVPFWLKTVHVRVDTMMMGKPFGEPRLTDYGWGTGGGGVMTTRNPLSLYRAFPPGEQLSLPLSTKIEHTGEFSATFTVSSIQQKQLLLPRPQTEPLSVDLNSALTPAECRPQASVTLYALPPATASSGDDQLELHVEPVPAQTGDPAGVRCFTLKLTSKHGITSVRLEKNLARYAWYAWVNADNVPVKSGSWRSVARGDEAAILAARTLETKASATWDLVLPPPTVAGVYTLIFGYEIDAQDKLFPAPDFALDPDSLVDHYDKGQLYTRVDSIAVVPVAEPTK